ncbi:hypothetical protein [Bordetella genomosp. 11]|uniref:hypothetical protein n=1 Tax=Bordetella genomosp. 11 TaxID=1416808 RepID=UPI00159617FF|nr:hypothetical protein [Bordetella genomosp. 11]
MMTKEIIQHLEQVQRNAAEEEKTVEEISQSELDQICGAGGVGGFANASWPKSF